MSVLEKTIEAYLVQRVRRIGGTAYKFTSPGRRSVPDRICLMPGGRLLFVECKAPGKKPTERQAAAHACLRALGFRVEVVSSQYHVDELVESLR